jgi:hypothetical protein
MKVIVEDASITITRISKNGFEFKGNNIKINKSELLDIRIGDVLTIVLPPIIAEKSD